MLLPISNSFPNPKKSFTGHQSEVIQLSDEVKYLQLQKLQDLIRVTSASRGSPPLHNKEAKDGHIYLLPASLALGTAVIYFVKTKEKVEKKYIVLDVVHDKMSFSDELSTKPSLKHFQIVEVKAQNILPRNLI